MESIMSSLLNEARESRASLNCQKADLLGSCEAEAQKGKFFTGSLVLPSRDTLEMQAKSFSCTPV